MKTVFPRRWVVLPILAFCFSCQAQTPEEGTTPVIRRVVGGPCEGCEAALEYGNRSLSAVDTIPGFDTESPMLEVYGTVYQSDGETPAANIVLYAYQTNRGGEYVPAEGAQGWGRRHGQHRGWIKTGPDGKYRFYTFRPGGYPGRDEPEHIHLTVLEPRFAPYYIDDVTFDDDPRLTTAKRAAQRKRGGNGITTPEEQAGRLFVRRDIILGENIPGYFPR
jgi:protocatechuate 3,4-dioxygenase beta subunit